MSTDTSGPLTPAARLKTEYSVTLYLRQHPDLRKRLSLSLKNQQMHIEEDQITSIEIRYTKNESRIDSIFGDLVAKIQKMKLEKGAENSLCDAICKARGEILHG